METLRAAMATLHILWFNLAIQSIVILICLKVLANHGGVYRALGVGGTNYAHLEARHNLSALMLAEERNPRSVEWHLDPLTQALTELATAKARIAEFEKLYVTQKEFLPIQRAVYGVVIVVGTTAITSILFLIWKGKP